jgi:REP-associated tyrosine transposase
MLKLAEKAVMSRTNRTYRSGAVARAHDERGAERLLSEGLAAAGLEEGALGHLPSSDVRKTALASLLLERTVARQSWIAERLAMRSAANVSQQVRCHRTKNRNYRLS